MKPGRRVAEADRVESLPVRERVEHLFIFYEKMLARLQTAVKRRRRSWRRNLSTNLKVKK